MKREKKKRWPRGCLFFVLINQSYLEKQSFHLITGQDLRGIVKEVVQFAVVVEDVGILAILDMHTATVAMLTLWRYSIGRYELRITANEDRDYVEVVRVFFKEHHQSFLVNDISDYGVGAQFAEVNPIVIAAKEGVCKHTVARRHVVFSDEVVANAIALTFTHGTRGVGDELADAKFTFKVGGEGGFTRAGRAYYANNLLFHFLLILLVRRERISAMMMPIIITIAIFMGDFVGDVGVCRWV